MTGTGESALYTAILSTPSQRDRLPQSHEDTDRQKGPSPLVSTDQLKSHLRLLGLFAFVKIEVEKQAGGTFNELPYKAQRLVNPGERWTWFLELAVERFRRWAMAMIDSEFTIVPPIDVWIIWHAYMLNPTWYAEDCERLPLLEGLKNLKEKPLDLVAKIGDNPFDFCPHDSEQLIKWNDCVKLDYNPLVSCNQLTHIEIACHLCKSKNNVPFLNMKKTGFAQENFFFMCNGQDGLRNCEARITRETLGVAKFIRDAKSEVHLPGTLLVASGLFSTDEAKKTKEMLKSDLIYGYKVKNLRHDLDRYLGASRAQKIVGAYEDGKPFSVELVSAAWRQTKFTEKMDNLKWLKTGHFDSQDDVKVLQQCATRYDGFLTLIQENNEFLVPTLDIDLAWHTHQLSPKAYREDCIWRVGKLVDHDDRVEMKSLSTGFDQTCRMWEDRFRVPYMYCGCPLPGATIGQRFSKLLAMFSWKNQPVNLAMGGQDCGPATHVSDHNLVFVGSWYSIIGCVWKWQRKYAIRVEREKKKALKRGESYVQDEDHREASWVSVPTTSSHGYPSAFSRHGMLCDAGVTINISGGNSSSCGSYSGGGCGSGSGGGGGCGSGSGGGGGCGGS